MDEARVMREVETLCKLDGDIVDHLDIGTRYIDRQVEIQTFDMAEDVASIVVLDH